MRGIDFYWSNPVVFVTKQTTLIQSHTAQVNFNSFGYLHISYNTQNHRKILIQTLATAHKELIE